MENKNTFPFQSNIYVESEVRPPAIIGYIYAPEEGDSMSLCESAEKAAVDFLGYPEQSGNIRAADSFICFQRLFNIE